MEKSVDLSEPGDLESLNMATAHIHSWNREEYVRIGIIPEDADGPNGTVSFQLVQFNKQSRCKSLQANLSRQEIDVVIKGLQEAKERMT